MLKGSEVFDDDTAGNKDDCEEEKEEEEEEEEDNVLDVIDWEIEVAAVDTDEDDEDLEELLVSGTVTEGRGST